VLAYQTQLDNLCDQAMRQRDPENLRKLLDQILQLLAENQESAGEVSGPHSCGTDPTRRIRRINNPSLRLVAMPCKSCGSLNQGQFTWGSSNPFSRTEKHRQAHRVGISQAYCVFGLWHHGIYCPEI